MQKLRKYLSELSSNTHDSEIESWLTKFSLKNYRKSASILEAGRRCKHYYFVDKGAIRMFIYGKEKETTVWLTGENSFFTHLYSFNNDKISDCTVESIEDTKLYLLSKNNYDYLMNTSPYFSRFILNVWQEAFIKTTRAIVAFQRDSADERYENLQSETDYTLRFKQKFLASFLGVTPTSLSRLKRNK